jgi:SAM-dependent methyltransferase
MANGAPGGIAREAAKWAAEQILWKRAALQHALDARAHRTRRKPASVVPTDVLSTRADWQRAVAQLRALRLPLHRDKPKNWDALAALSFVLDNVAPSGAVLDAGCARYSTLLPSLRLYGCTDLFGNHLERSRPSHHGPVRLLPGDMTATSFPDARFDAITCLSVIEHGVPIKGFLIEAARLLRPNGVLFISTDYDQDPPDTTGKTAYGQPVHIFSPDEIHDIVKQADDVGLTLVGDLKLAHAERPVHWERVGVDYTFISLGFRRKAD